LCAPYGDRQRAAVTIAGFLDGAEHAAGVAPQERVVLVERVAPLDVLAIWGVRRKHFAIDVLGKEDLACDDLVVVEKDFEVHVRRASTIPARVNRPKADAAVCVRDLRAAQERLAFNGLRPRADAGL